MTILRRGLLGPAVAATLLPGSRAPAQASTIRVGVLRDRSGPFSSSGGATVLICVRQAIQEFGAANRGLSVEVVHADHQNKADVGAAIARQWLDQEDVDCILEISNSAVALAVQSIVRAKNKVYIVVAAGTSALTVDQCSPNMLHWTFDNYMLAHSTSSAMIKDSGDSWFFITADYTSGHQLERDTTEVVLKSSGRVLGRSVYPFPDTTDFASPLVQAQASRANESDAAQRPMFRDRHHPRGRPGSGVCLSVRSEEAVRKHKRLGLLQAACDLSDDHVAIRCHQVETYAHGF